MVFSLRASVARNRRAPRCVADTCMAYSFHDIDFLLLGGMMALRSSGFRSGRVEKPAPMLWSDVPCPHILSAIWQCDYLISPLNSAERSARLD